MPLVTSSSVSVGLCVHGRTRCVESVICWSVLLCSVVCCTSRPLPRWPLAQETDGAAALEKHTGEILAVGGAAGGCVGGRNFCSRRSPRRSRPRHRSVHHDVRHVPFPSACRRPPLVISITLHRFGRSSPGRPGRRRYEYGVRAVHAACACTDRPATAGGLLWVLLRSVTSRRRAATGCPDHLLQQGSRALPIHPPRPPRASPRGRTASLRLCPLGRRVGGRLYPPGTLRLAVRLPSPPAPGWCRRPSTMQHVPLLVKV